MTENDNQSAELTRFEDLVGKSWPDLVAWMKNREATERLLLGMVEKLTPAAQEMNHAANQRALAVAVGVATAPSLTDPPKTPAPATPSLMRWETCRHQWLFMNWLKDALKAEGLMVHRCGAGCGAHLIDGAIYFPAQPVSREEPKRPLVVSG
jgi:hypothetical protein